VLDKNIHSTLISLLNTTGVTNLMIKATTNMTNSWPRSVKKPSIFCNANETEETHENHRLQQMAHRRKWNHKHPTRISTNLWVSTFFQSTERSFVPLYLTRAPKKHGYKVISDLATTHKGVWVALR